MSRKRLHNTSMPRREDHRVTGEKQKLATGHEPRKGTIIMRDKRGRKQQVRKKRWSEHD